MKQRFPQAVTPSRPECGEPPAVGGARVAAGVAVWMALLSSAPATAETRQPTPHPFDDGSADATTGTPLLPNLLAGYPARPPWMVAGVDYAVGAPGRASRLDPATISMTGVTVNAAAHMIIVTGSNVTLNGYDFGRLGGWGIYLKSEAKNTVIKNNNFLVGSNNIVPVNATAGSGSLTVLNNTFDGGNGSDAIWALINYNGTGTFVARHNIFMNAPADAIDFGGGTMTTIVEYNVFENLGTSPGAHPDTVQFVAVNSTNSIESFNTIYQPHASGEQGVQLSGANGSVQINTLVENNVIVAKGPAICMSYSIAVYQDPGNTIDGAVVSNNYIDFTGAYGPFYRPSGRNLTFTHNVNLRTGAEIPNPPGIVSSDINSVTTSPASGTATSGSTIAFGLHMDEAEFVTGAPTLALNNGGTATYISGSGSNTLMFSYTVANTDRAVSPLAISRLDLPPGSLVRDAAGNTTNFGGIPRSLPGLEVKTGTTGRSR